MNRARNGLALSLPHPITFYMGVQYVAPGWPETCGPPLLSPQWWDRTQVCLWLLRQGLAKLPRLSREPRAPPASALPTLAGLLVAFQEERYQLGFFFS